MRKRPINWVEMLNYDLQFPESLPYCHVVLIRVDGSAVGFTVWFTHCWVGYAALAQTWKELCGGEIGMWNPGL